MNTYRKIQLSAAAVIANGALTIGLMSSAPAVAQGICYDYVCLAGQCPANPASECPKTYSGCNLEKFFEATCSGPTNQPPCTGESTITCIYIP
jgi:hypothetical protein